MFFTFVKEGTKCIFFAFKTTIKDMIISKWIISDDEALRILNIDKNYAKNILEERYKSYLERNFESPYIQSKITNAYIKLNKNN